MTAQPNLDAGDDPHARPFQRPALPGRASWGRAPEHHRGQYVYPGRSVLVLVGHRWPHEPETCPVPDSAPGELHLGGLVLTCSGCGLDIS